MDRVGVGGCLFRSIKIEAQVKWENYQVILA
jgi:hypothetical protein